jgi:hypothetical protein
MQGRGTDPDRGKQLMAKDSDKWAAFRPEMIGSVAVGHDGGAYTMSCTSHVRPTPGSANARRCRPSCRRVWKMNKLSISQPEFSNLKQPVILSPK